MAKEEQVYTQESNAELLALYTDNPKLRAVVRLQNIKIREFHNQLADTQEDKLLSVLLAAIDAGEIGINKPLGIAPPLLTVLMRKKSITASEFDSFFARGATVHDNSDLSHNLLSGHSPEIIKVFLDAGFDPNKLSDEDSILPNLTTKAFAQGNFEAVDYLESIGYYLQEEVMVSMKNASGENEWKLLPLQEAVEMSQRMPEELKAKQVEYLRNR